MIDKKTRIALINKMEQNFDVCLKAEKELSCALENYKNVLGSFAELAAYYDGGDWKEDYEADEAGMLATVLKKGVLSQDGLYDLLTANKELTVEMLKLLTEIAKRGIR